jgi:hypothetical protein
MQPDELTPLERQLATCQPSAAGLDADAMLFAAGRAAAPASRPRFVWPIISCGFAFLSLVLAVGLASERSERRALADSLRQRPFVTEALVAAVMPPPAMSPDSYLAARRMIEHDADAWPAHDETIPDGGPSAPPPNNVLRAWGTVFEQ